MSLGLPSSTYTVKVAYCYSFIMYNKLLLAALLSATSVTSFAADYFVVVPVKNKSVSVSAIEVVLAQAPLPGAAVGSPYSYNFNQHVQVTGDATYSGYGVKWSLKAGSLPQGLLLNSSTGALTGTPTAAGESSFSVAATYKTKVGTSTYQISATNPSCTLPWGGTLSDGASIQAFSASTIAAPGTCASLAVTEQCTLGVLSHPSAVQTCSATDPNFGNVAYVLAMDGAQGSTTIVDPRPAAFTAGTGVSLDTTTPKFGSASAKFTGIAGATTTATSAVTPSTGDFTFETWVYLSGWAQGSNVNNGVLVSAGVPGSNLTWQFGIKRSTNALYFVPGSGAAWGTAVYSSNNAVPLTTWTHVALVRTGTTLKMFANGTQVYSGTQASFGGSSAGSVYVGGYLGCVGGPAANWCDNFVGNLDDVRWTSGLARYTSNFTKPVEALPVQ